MTVWESKPRAYWLKSIGSADDPQADDWVVSAPQELTYVAFPDSGKPSVRTNDYLVYYAGAPHQKLVGVVEAFTPPARDNCS